MGPPALMRRFPSLEIPWISLGKPAKPFVRLSPSDHAPLWMFDSSHDSAVYGGSKVRKLEFLLADALAKGHRELITTGAAGSNHVVAVATLGNTLGLRTHAVITPQPPSEHARRNREKMDLVCASVTEVGAWLLVPPAMAKLWATYGGYIIGPGGSGGLGTLGWVAAGLELAEAEQQGVISPFTEVVVAVGSSGTAAGLLAGLRLAGHRAEVLGVRVVDRVVASKGRVRRIAKVALRMLGAESTDLSGFQLIHDAAGVGYGVADAVTDKNSRIAAELGFYTEPTYTAKSLGVALQRAQSGAAVVWVNTVAATEA